MPNYNNPDEHPSRDQTLTLHCRFLTDKELRDQGFPYRGGYLARSGITDLPRPTAAPMPSIKKKIRIVQSPEVRGGIGKGEDGMSYIYIRECGGMNDFGFHNELGRRLCEVFGIDDITELPEWEFEQVWGHETSHQLGYQHG